MGQPLPVASVVEQGPALVYAEEVGGLLVHKEIELLLELGEQVLEAELLWTPTDFSGECISQPQ